MPELPPRDVVLDALMNSVAPAAGAAAAVFGGSLLVSWLVSRKRPFDWRRVAAPAAVLALAGALAAGNASRNVFPWSPDGKWWHWAWWAVGLAVAVEFVARFTGVAVGYLLRGTAAGVIAAFVVLPAWQAEEKWWIPAVAAVLAAGWAVVAAVGRRSPGGSLPAAVAVACGGAAVVLIHHVSAGFADVATFAFVALGVLAVIAWLTGGDAGPAAAAATVPVVVLPLLGRALVDSKVPRASFLLVALAPLTLGVLLIPRLRWLDNTRAATPLKVLLVLVPVAVAVTLAVEAAPYSFAAKEAEW